MAVDLSSNPTPSSSQLDQPSTGYAGDVDSSDRYLFHKSILKQITKWPQIQDKLDKLNLLARPLRQDDYNNGYLELLKQLTDVGEVSKDDFDKRFVEIKRANTLDGIGEQYLIVVIEDKTSGSIVACSTLFLELKFIHQCAKRARLEDVAVLDTWRGKGVGLIIVDIIVQLANEVYHCYKLTLDCTDDLIKFYSQNNFTYGSNQLCIKFA